MAFGLEERDRLNLRGLLPLVAPLLSGHSDLAIGTRLAHGARVVRGPKRELISRGYNRILHAILRARFSDAQCGFKAARTAALGADHEEPHDHTDHAEHQNHLDQLAIGTGSLSAREARQGEECSGGHQRRLKLGCACHRLYSTCYSLHGPAV